MEHVLLKSNGYRRGREILKVKYINRGVWELSLGILLQGVVSGGTEALLGYFKGEKSCKQNLKIKCVVLVLLSRMGTPHTADSILEGGTITSTWQ